MLFFMKTRSPKFVSSNAFVTISVNGTEVATEINAGTLDESIRRARMLFSAGTFTVHQNCAACEGQGVKSIRFIAAEPIRKSVCRVCAGLGSRASYSERLA